MRNRCSSPDGVDRLSFVAFDCEAKDRRGPRLWTAVPSGDYAADCERGADMALEMLAWERDRRLARPKDWHFWLLQQVALDQCKTYSPEQLGLLVGFWETIAYACGMAIDGNPGLVRCLHECIEMRRDAARRHSEAQAEERRQQARRAAQARWAKHRACVAAE